MVGNMKQMKRLMFSITAAIMCLFVIVATDCYGALIAAVYTHDKIYLFSDGRVLDNKTKIVRCDYISKVHQITDKVALLTAGVYIPELTAEIVYTPGVNLGDINSIVKASKQTLEKKWTKVIDKNNRRAILFVVGYDQGRKHRLFMIDSKHEPPFTVIEKKYAIGRDSLELVAMSTGSGDAVNPSNILKSHILSLVRQGIPKERLVEQAFRLTKEEMGKNNKAIGGKIFSATLYR